jgi:putative sterol carrier protein
VTVRDGACTVVEGVVSAPQATMTTAASDYLLVAQGKLNSMKAFLTGRIKVSGDFGLLKKFETWFVH